MTTLTPLNLDIKENIAVDTVIGTVLFETDSIISSFSLSNNIVFEINASGEISTKALLDFSTQPEYILSVMALDTDGYSKAVEVRIKLEYIPILTHFVHYFQDDRVHGIDSRDFRFYTPTGDWTFLNDAWGAEPTAEELADIRLNIHTDYDFVTSTLSLTKKAQIDIDTKNAADVEAKRVADIKAKADSIILASYSKDKQDKLMMQGIFLVHENSVRTLTTGAGSEQEELDGIIAVRHWITAVRTIENTAIANGTLFTDVDWTVA